MTQQLTPQAVTLMIVGLILFWVSIATLDDGERSTELDGLLRDIAALSDQITYRSDGSATRVPSFDIRRAGTAINVRFAGIPLGHEFTSLVLALLQVGGHPPKVDDDVAAGAAVQLVVALAAEDHEREGRGLAEDVVVVGAVERLRDGEGGGRALADADDDEGALGRVGKPARS